MVKLSRRPLPERFVRPLLVVDAPKLVEAFLLGRPAPGRRTRRLLLQRPMHPFVPAILLRVARLNALQANSQLEPAHREARQASQRAGAGKRTAIVRPYRLRQPVLLKQPLEHRPSQRLGHRVQSLHSQQETAVPIADRQWVAPVTVASAKLT